ncbi:MAG: FIST N-terminal domain-containing protein [Planctomycetota bacterium]
MSTIPTSATRCAAALAIDEEPLAAADRLADVLAADLDGLEPSLLTLFVAAEHAGRATDIAARLAARVESEAILAVTAESVLAGATEAEHQPALAAWALHADGLEVHPFTDDDLPARPEQDHPALADALALDRHARCVVTFIDPFSVPVVKLLPSLNACCEPPPPLVGAMASAAQKPGGNVLILNDEARHAGLVGVTLRQRADAAPPGLRVDTVVSQGCRPVGPDLVITKARGNAIQQLGGRNALEVVQEVLESLPQEDRVQLQKGLFLGRVINEYKERFGRGDYLIRAVVGAEPNSGTIAVGDVVKVGQTVRLHLRDANTATEDLALLLDGQKLHGPPAGALLFTCNGRGASLFDAPHHDAAAITRAFSPPEAGERLAKAGKPYAETPTARQPIPLAGCFAAGEIGPIGGQSFLHGHTASLVLFR